MKQRSWKKQFAEHQSWLDFYEGHFPTTSGTWRYQQLAWQLSDDLLGIDFGELRDVVALGMLDEEDQQEIAGTALVSILHLWLNPPNQRQYWTGEELNEVVAVPTLLAKIERLNAEAACHDPIASFPKSVWIAYRLVFKKRAHNGEQVIAEDRLQAMTATEVQSLYRERT